MNQGINRFYEFGPFRIDAVERVLLREGEPVPLTQKVFDILLLLVENNGHVVEKERLMKEVWPDACVEEGNLTQNIWILRKALDAGETGRQYLQTVPRRGYRFTAPVNEVAGDGELIIEEHLRTHVVVEEHEEDVSETREFSSAIVQAPPSNAALVSPARRKHWRAALSVSTALSVMAILAAYLAFSNRRTIGTNTALTNPGAPTAPRSIAVLPFQLLEVNAGDEFLGLALTDALISRLSNIKEVKVRPTSAVQKYSGREREAAAIGKELRVDSVLDGAVQRDANRIRVSVQLVDVKDGGTLWSHTFDERFTDIFAVEDAISEKIAQEMTLKLTEDERARLAKHHTDDPQAHEFYLQGRFNLNKFTEDGTRLARQYFQQAIDRDSVYAQAYGGLAESFAFGEIGLPPEQAFPKARAAATKAIEVDDAIGEAHAALAQVAFLWDWDWPAAETQFRRALELTPGDPEIHHMYAHYLSAMGRFDEALAESQRLLDLDPLSPASRNHLGWNYLYAHQFDQAIEQYRLVLAVDPNFVEAHRQLAEAYWEQGRFDESVEEMGRRLELAGRGGEAPVLKEAYRASGSRGLWQKRLQLAMERSKHSYMSPSGFASDYVQLKDTPRALEWLERAYREHDHDLVYLKVDHTWDSLRSLQPFQDLVKRMLLAD